VKRTIAKNVKKLITWYINENGAQFDLYFGLMDLMDLLLRGTLINNGVQFDKHFGFIDRNHNNKASE
jgi:hypothetical protein